MKKVLILTIVSLFTLAGIAQLNPVIWSFSAVKTSDKMYEIHMKATIQDGWHLYSQRQPDDAIAIPTAFVVNANPLFSLEGKVKEVGKMEVMNDKELGVSANQYSKEVDFVQKIKLKVNAKTNFNGTVEYQTCDDKKCLPPKKVNFSIALK
ncbi:MAG TPA: protein-disulfide reductase DsbD domain-containing protein [Chitinophagaceae bacterium]|nr:protein-disulfide reductase DsbD domain-containing protein [Chitinophagaceae bacterium]